MSTAPCALGSAVAGLLGLAVLLRLRGRPLLWHRPAAWPEDVSLGAAGAGVHAPRLLGAMALVDLLGSLALAALCAAVSGGSVVAWTVLVLVVGEAMHAAFGVRTATQKWLFGYDT